MPTVNNTNKKSKSQNSIAERKLLITTEVRGTTMSDAGVVTKRTENNYQKYT